MPPPVEPIEERIEAAIAGRLSTIAAGDDYWTTPLVTRELLTIDQYSESQLAAGVLGVARASATVLDSPFMDGSLDLGQRVAVVGYVTKAAGVIAGTALNRLFADHLRCLKADPKLGGLVDDFRPDPGPRDTDDAGRDPKAFFRQFWVARVIEDF